MNRQCLSSFIVLAAALVAVACGETSPTTPSENLTVTGRWAGSYRVTTCNGGNEACQDPALRPSYPITFVLTQDEAGRLVTGTMTADVPVGISNGQLTSTSIPVTGSFDLPTRTLHLEGSQPFNRGDSSGGFQAGIVFSQWTTLLATTGVTMTGTFQVAVTFQRNNAFPSIWTSQAEFINLSKQP
jgi:hypothetical protein